MNAPASPSTTALTVREQQPQQLARPGGPLRPIVRPVEMIEAHKEAAAVIREALEDRRDYGTIPNAGPRKVLLKPGAERLLVAFGLQPHYEIVTAEADHDRIVEYTDRKKGKSTSTGLYRYVVRCTLSRDGAVVGEGIGSCSTMEQKYVSRPRDCENTVLKMAKKRAVVDAVLGTLSLSDRFTQDVDDSGDGGGVEGEVVDPPKPPPTKAKGSLAAVLDLAEQVTEMTEAETLAWAVDQIAGVTDGAPKMTFALKALVEQRAAQLGDVEWTGNDDEKKAVAWLRGELEKRPKKPAQQQNDDDKKAAQ